MCLRRLCMVPRLCVVQGGQLAEASLPAKPWRTPWGCLVVYVQLSAHAHHRGSYTDTGGLAQARDPWASASAQICMIL